MAQKRRFTPEPVTKPGSHRPKGPVGRSSGPAPKSKRERSEAPTIPPPPAPHPTARVHDDDRAITRVLASYLEHLEAILRTRRYRPIGEVTRVVAELQASGAVVGIATGNLREGARLKLASAGLEKTFDLGRGGFGC